MTDKCFQSADFERLLDLPDGHPDRQHLDTCPACRTQLDQFRSFLSRDNPPAGADLADAKIRLGEFLEREVGGGHATSVLEVVPAVKGRRDLRRWSPVLVAACLVCMVMVVNYGNKDQVNSPSGIVRDTSVETPVLETFEAATADGFVLSWSGPAEADRYQVIVLDATMAEVERLAGDLSGEYRLNGPEHPWLQNSGPFMWYVVALRDGDEIARSSVRTLEPSP